MLKINKSILIICIVSLFLIIGQISASDTDLIEINESDTIDNQIDKLIDNQIDDLKELKDSDSIDERKDDEIIEKIEKQTKGKSEIVMSNDDYSCGAASFATALNNMGMNISLDEAKMAANTSINGTSMKGLVDAAAKYNLTAYGVYADSSNLKENFIVHMNINGAEHWSVIKEISKDSITLADPSLGCIEYDLGTGILVKKIIDKV